MTDIETRKWSIEKAIEIEKTANKWVTVAQLKETADSLIEYVEQDVFNIDSEAFESIKTGLQEANQGWKPNPKYMPVGHDTEVVVLFEGGEKLSDEAGFFVWDTDEADALGYEKPIAYYVVE